MWRERLSSRRILRELKASASALHRAEHAFQQFGRAGGRVLADAFLFVGDHLEQAVAGLLCDVAVHVEGSGVDVQLAEQGSGARALSDRSQEQAFR